MKKGLKIIVANNHLYLLNVAITDLLKTLASLSHALVRLDAAGESCTHNCQPYQHTNRFCIPVEPPPPFGQCPKDRHLFFF